jgi:hypothetical protein
MRLGGRFGVPDFPARPYHDQVFPLGRLEEVIGIYGMPRDDLLYADYHRSEFEKYVEIQLWYDDPILDVLNTG